jgi:methionyl aminopeptidase
VEGGGGDGGQISTDEIGNTISKTMESDGFSPVINLSGHSMQQYELHSGITIPNINDGKNIKLKDGLYALEPFATTGSGKVHEGKPSGIYELRETKNIRNPISREILEFIKKEYNTLPFCSRWLVKKFGTRALFGLKQLEDNGNLHHFPQLVEVQGSRVSQAEHTVLISGDKVTVTTE